MTARPNTIAATNCESRDEYTLPVQKTCN